MKRFSNVNGKRTKLNKTLTAGSLGFIIENAGKMSTKNIANVLHRPVRTVLNAASRLGVSLELS